ncbi:hypothetical protein [Actinomyces ruminis]|uniref:Tat pathway signal sequence n=1 Tax=Actinomyces ruminis TaxID=1937003 RepID=A0ABX4M9S0_9ACTO|nr:hypothetical protein [Actinomyces ruminis]PHP52197.1 Tat pathway signal sequence [Actinomyces ruminis]
MLLDVAGADGALMKLTGLLSRQTNGVGQEGRDDALVDPVTLELIRLSPLESHSESTACVELPDGRQTCLCLSWPTSHGYSALFADLPGPGRYALAELAASGLHQRQDQLVNTLRSAGKNTEPIQTLRSDTAQALTDCSHAATPVERAILANQALEAATAAQLALDEAVAGTGPDDAMLGVTFTAPPETETVVQAVSPLKEAGRNVVVRIVVNDTDDSEELEGWRRCVAQLRAQGAKYMVQVCDSQFLTDFSDTEWDRRLTVLRQTLPNADAWEIGNELGGEWTGPDAVTRTLQAARALATDPATAKSTRVLTLYYQLGQGTATESVMSWAATNLNGELAELTDVVGLSVYPQWHPLGAGARGYSPHWAHSSGISARHSQSSVTALRTWMTARGGLVPNQTPTRAAPRLHAI